MSLRFSAFAAVAAVVVPAAAEARGAIIDSSALDGLALAQLRHLAEDARRVDPEPFDEIARLAMAMPAMDAQKRGRIAPVARSLKNLGPEALPALLSAIALHGESGEGWTPTARVAWQAGLLEAVGELADGRAVAVLDAVLAKRPADYLVMRAAVVARAWLGDAAGTAQLVTLASVEGPHRTAALAGIGYTRRVEAAKVLAEAAAESMNVERSLAVIEALSDVGNAWVWPLITDVRRADEAPIRHLAASALVDLHLRLGGDLGRRAANALLVVADDTTPAVIEAARARGGDRAALEALSRRVEKNPLRTR